MASRELICRVGARREGVGDQHRFLSRVWVSSRVLVEREGRGGCCCGISYHGREGVYIYIDRPSCRSYLEGVISTTTRHIYTWENNVIVEGVSVPPLVLKFLLSPLFLSSSTTLLFLLLPRERKIIKEKEEKRKKEEGRKKKKKNERKKENKKMKKRRGRRGEINKKRKKEEKEEEKKKGIEEKKKK